MRTLLYGGSFLFFLCDKVWDGKSMVGEGRVLGRACDGKGMLGAGHATGRAWDGKSIVGEECTMGRAWDGKSLLREGVRWAGDVISRAYLGQTWKEETHIT